MKNSDMQLMVHIKYLKNTVNPSNVKATFVQSTRMQRFAKNI